MNKYYYEMVIRANNYEESFLNFLMEHFHNAIEESDEGFILRSEESLNWLEPKIVDYFEDLKEIFDDHTLTLYITQDKKENKDWIDIYKKSITPIEVEPFYIHPTWVEAKKDALDIIINPALAFGSGHHQTTSSCLQAIAKYVKKGDTLLDVGCGSGILSIAGNKLGAHVSLCDTDPLAIEESQKNFALNDATITQSWIGSVTTAKRSYDVVIANIVADILVLLAKDLKGATNQGGLLILSGIIDRFVDQVKKKYANLELVEHIELEGWNTLIFRKDVDVTTTR